MPADSSGLTPALASPTRRDGTLALQPRLSERTRDLGADPSSEASLPRLGARVGETEALATLGGSWGKSDLDAVIASLYEERRVVLQRRRLGQGTAGDESYLAELEGYIDHLEAKEQHVPTGTVEALQAIAKDILALRAEVERGK